jgi:hypothetical protein
MLIGFFDDTELVVDDDDYHPDIFVYGGYIIEQGRLSEFQERICTIKEDYGLLGYSPIKWNIRDDALSKFYNHANGLNPNSFNTLVDKAPSMRRDLLALLSEFNATIMVSARYDKSKNPETLATYSLWAFENLLQRMGMMAQFPDQGKKFPGLMVVADWPSTALEKGLFNVYVGGYHYGYGLSTNQNYFSGPLKQYGFSDCLFHASTMHSGPLQVADLVAGCCKDFLHWAWKGERRQRIEGLFDLLIERFYRNPNGIIHNAGFILTKAYRFDVDVKIEEYLHPAIKNKTLETNP